MVGWGYNPVFGCDGVNYNNQTSTGVVTIAGRVLDDVIAISAGDSHSLALKRDGTVAGWGIGLAGQSTGSTVRIDHTNGLVAIKGQQLKNITAIAAGSAHSLALKSDGIVVAWGDPFGGATAVPDGLSNVVAIAAGGEHSLAVRVDGSVVGWGMTKVPDSFTNIVMVTAAESWKADDFALTRDGTVIRWNGRNSRVSEPVPGLSNVVAIASGTTAFQGDHHLALLKNGTVKGWGYVSEVPEGLSNVVSIAAAAMHSLALKSDGTVVAWGKIGFQPVIVPEGLSNIVAIAAGPNFCLAITTNRAVAEKFFQK